ncbi:MAG: iron-containing redox enzyme family protein [Gammaproteobacteria bacterium]|nr:MAG: iron-containing redox enzyme family protein [Gammaproteobacteria bacterium]
MSFHDRLTEATSREREFLLAAPAIRETLAGTITLPRYLAFLSQAWHHVRHTVPLLMAAGSHLPSRLAWMQKDLLHYLQEEIGHDAWILNDIRAAGGDVQAVTASVPHPATDALVAYVYDNVQRRNPVGIFGMVFVLEGTSVALALHAADRIQATLALPDGAFTYLRSHGTLDRQHVDDLKSILARLTEPADHAAIVQCARAMFWLYGQMFRGLDEVTVPIVAAGTRKRA